MNIVKKYRFFFITLIVLFTLVFINRKIGINAVNITLYEFKTMAMVIPPIFILLGLLDIWIPRETMIKYMGEKSGIKGIILALLIGSAAAGPLYGAFPIAAVFMKKGVKFTNVLIFIGAWSTTKIPMFLFEISSLGKAFAITRLLVDIPGIIIISYFIVSILPKDEIEKVYKKVES